MEAAIADNHITLEGTRYFIGNATSIAFGGYGDKKTPLRPGDPHSLNQVGIIPPRNLEGVRLKTAAFEMQLDSRVGLGEYAAVKIAGLGKLKLKLGAREVNEYDVKLVRVMPASDNELITAINDSPRVKGQLIDIGGDARVVESVLIAVTYEHYRKFEAGLQGKAAVVVDGLVVEAGRSAGWFKENEVSVSPGAVIGYSLAEPKWDATRDRNKTRVVALRPDQQGR